MLNSRKIMKIMSTLNFETPLQLNLDPQSKFFFHHIVLNYFLGKVPNAQKCSTKISIKCGSEFPR